jgi:hypothetical protein
MNLNPAQFLPNGLPNILNRSSDRTSGNVTEEELKWMQTNAGYCPDCGGDLLEGPHGGGSVNVLCNTCLNKFNIMGFVWIERIGSASMSTATTSYGLNPVKIGISTFAQKNIPEPEKLIRKIRANWSKREKGAGRIDHSQVVLVPIPNDGYYVRSVAISDDYLYEAFFTKRAEGEDPFIGVAATGLKPRGLRWLLWKLGLVKPLPIPREPAKFVKAVCYSAATIAENNGTRSGDFDWEVVAVITSSVDDEPMEPLTMARNYLQKSGGTYAPYSTTQIAESIYHWSQRVSVKK